MTSISTLTLHEASLALKGQCAQGILDTLLDGSGPLQNAICERLIAAMVEEHGHAWVGAWSDWPLPSKFVCWWHAITPANGVMPDCVVPEYDYVLEKLLQVAQCDLSDDLHEQIITIIKSRVAELGGELLPWERTN